MIGQLRLSEPTQGLLKEYLAETLMPPELFANEPTEVAAKALVNWLQSSLDTKTEKKSEFMLTALRVSLIKDLCSALPGESEAESETKEASLGGKIQFISLGLAGTLVAACQGFDSMCTLLGLFPTPTLAVLLVGLAFALLSVTVFYAVDLAQVARNTGVRFVDAPKLLDLYAMQQQEIHRLTQKIRAYSLATLSNEALEELDAITKMMQSQVGELKEAALTFDAARQGPNVKIAQGLFTAISGLLYFGGGFFAGQTVGFFFLGLITVTPMIWPPILFSGIVGLAAFALYWFTQREALDKAISTLFGLDENQIDALCAIPKQEEKALTIVCQQIEDSLAARGSQAGSSPMVSENTFFGAGTRASVDHNQALVTALGVA